MVRDLERELFRYGAAGCLLLLIFSGSLLALEGAGFTLRFFAFSMLCWGYVCRQCWKLLALNTPDHDTALYSTLGHANRLTLLRAFLISCTAGFLFNDFSHATLGFIPAVLYTIAAILDRVDGYLARRQKQTTLLGSELDTIIDALGLLVAPLLAVLYGKAHASYLLVSAAWYLFSWGLYWRRSHYQATYPLLPSKLRRTMAGFQMGFVAGALWPPLDPRMTQGFGVAFMVPLLLGFLIDWLVVSGRINTRTPHAFERFLLLGTFMQRWAMPVLRFALLAVISFAITTQQIMFILSGASTTTLPLFAAGAVFVACLLGIATGFLGRACATTVMLLVCWFYPFATMNALAASTIALTVLVILLGTGSYSLRRADETWINRQDGA